MSSPWPCQQSQARTIDLCNNPKTKEPKLQAARRILPEWEGLDVQQAELTRSIEERLAAEDEAADAVIVGGEPAAAVVLGDEEGVTVLGDEEGVMVEGGHDEL